MGMMLRITFNKNDYNFQIVNKVPIAKATVEIPIVIQGHALNIFRSPGGWVLKEPDDEIQADLVQAIGKSIELRYRL